MSSPAKASDSSTPASPRKYQKSLSTLLLKQELKEQQTIENGRKTKIICTIGPGTKEVNKLCELINAGMNIARLNFSHGEHSYHAGCVKNVREAVKLTKKTCPIMLDTKGPEIRTGKIKGGKAMLHAGQELTIVTKYDPDTFVGDEKTVAIDYKNLPKVVKPGSIIKMADGVVHLTVTSTNPETGVVKVTCKNTAEIGNTKGCNLPGTKVDLPAVTEKDKADFKFAVEHQVDFIAASFVRSAEHVREMRALLGEKGAYIKIISKIENQQGMDNFDDILEASDGIMVARGDLGVEIPIQQVCMAQKNMIRKCNIAGKPVVTATQMLESMIVNPRPTRAEAGDVANAVFDGTDCVMLSGETAKGDYPVEAVTVMAKICRTAELALDYQSILHSMMIFTKKPINRTETITSAAVKAAHDLSSPLIICVTQTGNTARYVAKYKPSVPILTVMTDEEAARQAIISRAVWPFLVKRQSDEKMIEEAIMVAKANGWVKSGQDIVLILGTTNQGVSGSTNTLKIIQCP